MMGNMHWTSRKPDHQHVKRKKNIHDLLIQSSLVRGRQIKLNYTHVFARTPTILHHVYVQLMPTGLTSGL